MPQTNHTTCCIVGGGPAGMMLGYLLARDGVPVVVLEKHADFFRDFRGDTVHPSTLELLYELGLLDDFLKVKHTKLASVGGSLGGYEFTAARFQHVPTRCKFVALMPQWDFLDFIASRAREFKSFDLRMKHKAVDLIIEDGVVKGVEVETEAGKSERIFAHLTIGCDGRHSLTRGAAGFEVIESGVPIDVLWFHLPRVSNDPEHVFGDINYGHALILINRDDYFQAGLIIRKNSFPEIQQQGIGGFQATLRQMAPHLGNRVDVIKSWDDVKLLSVQINRLRKWHRPGVLCIGDAAHAMSPAGGVGINIAIQDAVAAANILSRPLREQRVTDSLLAEVQERRQFPVRVTQFAQLNAHKLLNKVFASAGPLKAPWQMKFVLGIPGIQDVMGRVVGIGVQPEHVTEEKKFEPSAKIKLRRFAVGCGLAAAYLGAGIYFWRRYGSGDRGVADGR